MFDEWLRLLPGLPDNLAVSLLGVLAAVENIFPPVPADTAVALGAFLAARSGLTLWAVFWATWVGNVGSAVAVYLATRRIGRPFFQGRLGQRLLKPQALTRIEQLHRRFGSIGIFLSRCIPGVRAVVPPFAGIANLGVVQTVVPLAAASALWYGGITYLAGTLIQRADAIQQLIRQINRAGWVISGLLVVAVATWLFRRYRRPRTDQ